MGTAESGGNHQVKGYVINALGDITGDLVDGEGAGQDAQGWALRPTSLKIRQKGDQDNGDEYDVFFRHEKTPYEADSVVAAAHCQEVLPF